MVGPADGHSRPLIPEQHVRIDAQFPRLRAERLLPKHMVALKALPSATDNASSLPVTHHHPVPLAGRYEVRGRLCGGSGT